MGPRISGGVVWHLVFGHSGVHLMALTQKYGTLTAPASMFFGLALYASQPVLVVAGGGAMVAHARPAYVEGLLAVVRHMAPPLAFQASSGFFLTLLSIHSLLTDDETIS